MIRRFFKRLFCFHYYQRNGVYLNQDRWTCDLCDKTIFRDIDDMPMNFTNNNR